MMNDIDPFLRSLDLQDELPDTTAAQIECNQHRRKMHKLLNAPHPEPSPTVFTDFQLELIKQKIADPNYRFSFRSLLEE